jgi:hypothetical protein
MLVFSYNKLAGKNQKNEKKQVHRRVGLLCPKAGRDRNTSKGGHKKDGYNQADIQLSAYWKMQPSQSYLSLSLLLLLFLSLMDWQQLYYL